MNLWTGLVMLTVAVILIVIGCPNKAGEHPKFLRFGAALVLYPPFILVFIALGAAGVIFGLLSK